jgi:hypothetical protein
MATAARGAAPIGLWLSGLLLLLGCLPRGRLVGGSFVRGAVAYRVGQLPAVWLRVADRDNDLVFHHRQGGIIVANGKCRVGSDVPLTVLTNHLLFGIERTSEVPAQVLTLDGRAALHSQLIGALDGVPVELGLVVVKKDSCVYDLQLIASPPQFAARRRDFDSFFLAFATQPPPGSGP